MKTLRFCGKLWDYMQTLGARERHADNETEQEEMQARSMRPISKRCLEDPVELER